ncbi:MAG: outer membrane protein [Melioribacteraceae bacterium]|nr:MAG: outer membrane protein [Melioribacteraceae bacterium]
MKFNKIFVLFISVLLIALVGCEDRSDLTAPEAPNTGTADFSSFVSIGNSLTAGFADNSLYESAQVYSFGNQIAEAVGAQYVQPLVSDPGLPGRLEVDRFIIQDGSIASVVLTQNTGLGAALNSSHAAPFNNLGVPGAILYDLVDETSFAQKAVDRGNPYFQLVLRDAQFGASIVKQAANLSPTFITMWIGNNDVLGYATSGGTSGTDATGKLPTDLTVFSALYNQVGAALAATGAKVVVANIPDINAIPFFNTVGPLVGVTIKPLIDAGQIAGVYYQKHGETVASGLADFNTLVSGAIKFTLVGTEYASLIGQPGGKFYVDYGYPALPAGIDTTQPFGLHPQNPWPDAFTLDADEQSTIATHVAGFNSTISSVATNNNFGLVDVNSIFGQIKASEATGGTTIDGIIFTTQFLSGGLFGLDGVHPTAQGQAVVANEFIKVINSKWSASIPHINVSEIPGTIFLAKTIEKHPHLIPIFENLKLEDFTF